MVNRRFFLLLSPLVLLSFAGCGGDASSGAPEIPTELKIKNPVSGQVIMEGGRSPEACRVEFLKEDETDKDAVVARGGCDAFGYFKMQTGATNDGAPPGKYKVLLFQSARPSKYGERPSTVDALGGRYSDVNNPQITVEIPPGGKTDLQFKVTPLTNEEVEQAMADYVANQKSSKNKDKQ